MQERHFNRDIYINEQSLTTEKYVIPYVSEFVDVGEKLSVLEIGCGEGGNLRPFLDAGCDRVVGVDLSEPRVKLAIEHFKDHERVDHIEFIAKDIYKVDDLGQFDLIITRDVLEHIHGQERFMEYIKKFLKPNGKLFQGFPPWYNPFGGHQQTCQSKVLSILPYFHILPRFLYKGILQMFGERERQVENLLEIKDTGITIERYERILKKTGYNQLKRTLFLINPNYETKFGLKPRIAWGIVSGIPYLRNFYITVDYSVVEVK